MKVMAPLQPASVTLKSIKKIGSYGLCISELLLLRKTTFKITALISTAATTKTALGLNILFHIII